MVALEIIAKAIAASVYDSRKFNAKEQLAAQQLIAKNAAPEDVAESLVRIGNVSAIDQELKKGGALPMGEPSALARAVKDELAKLDAAKAAEKTPVQPKK